MLANCIQVGNGESALKVRLDVFHALQRVSKLCKKSHGAFKPFMARLRDACFIVNLDDIKEASVVDVVVVGRINTLDKASTVGITLCAPGWCIVTDIQNRFKLQVEQALAGKGMTPEDVAEYKDKNWTFFVRNCRRLVPEQKRLLERFILVIGQFQNVVDAKTGEVLPRPFAMQAVEQLRRHIGSGCLSDPERVPLYYVHNGAKFSGDHDSSLRSRHQLHRGTRLVRCTVLFCVLARFSLNCLQNTA